LHIDIVVLLNEYETVKFMSKHKVLNFIICIADKGKNLDWLQSFWNGLVE